MYLSANLLENWWTLHPTGELNKAHIRARVVMSHLIESNNDTKIQYINFNFRAHQGIRLHARRHSGSPFHTPVASVINGKKVFLLQFIELHYLFGNDVKYGYKVFKYCVFHALYLATSYSATCNNCFCFEPFSHLASACMPNRTMD